MLAVVCRELGPPDRLSIAALPDHDPGPTEVTIEVEFAGFNFPDLLIIQGLYQFQPPLPFAPGGEAAGRIVATGRDVSGFGIGDRVVAFGAFGAFAERWTVDQSVIVPVPDGIPSDLAAASTMTYGTSYHALVDRAGLTAGETLLVLGAAGGVGSAAIEIGKALGATVIAAASTPEKLEFCADLGADHLIDYSKEDVKSRTKEITRGGVDVIYDPVGGASSEPAFRAIGWQGRHLVVGFTAGDIPALPLNLPLLKGASITGVFWGSFAMRDPAAYRTNQGTVFSMIESGALHPRIMETVPMADYRHGFELLASRSVMGKIVLDVGQGS